MPDPPRPVADDARGILDPLRLAQCVQLQRYPTTGRLSGLVEWFWAVQWELPDGMRHRQELLTHPGANLSVGNLDADNPHYSPDAVEARCYGVATRLSTRVLVGSGWTVAAMTLPGGLGAFVRAPASYTDRDVLLSEVIPSAADLVERMTETLDESQRVRILGEELTAAIDPDREAAARQVTGVARVMETETVRTITDLAERTAIAPRTLQRQFREFAGVSPTWVLRRYRLLEAAEAVRHGERPSWSQLAIDLGYADQAHLIRDFRAATGRTPEAYARAQRQGFHRPVQLKDEFASGSSG